jgi:hypothetical protein
MIFQRVEHSLGPFYFVKRVRVMLVSVLILHIERVDVFLFWINDEFLRENLTRKVRESFNFSERNMWKKWKKGLLNVGKMSLQILDIKVFSFKKLIKINKKSNKQ